MRATLRKQLPTSYAEQTHASPYWIVRWPHEQRIRLAADAVIDHRPNTLLDYGAGDCHILTEVVNRGSGWLPDRVVAYEPSKSYAELTRATVEGLGLANRVDVKTELDSDEQFDFVTCMSVLEHLPLPERTRFYNLCQRGLSATGRILIDVPSEIGPSVLIKEFGRRALKAREPEYSTSELVRCALGAIQFDPERWDPENTSTWIQWHTGFDYRLFKRELQHHFRVVDSFGTPLRLLPAWLGNQEVFFLAERSA